MNDQENDIRDLIRVNVHLFEENREVKVKLKKTKKESELRETLNNYLLERDIKLKEEVELSSKSSGRTEY